MKQGRFLKYLKNLRLLWLYDKIKKKVSWLMYKYFNITDRQKFTKKPLIWCYFGEIDFSKKDNDNDVVNDIKPLKDFEYGDRITFLDDLKIKEDSNE